MTKLGVNIDHSATLRQARYRGLEAESGIIVEPNIIDVALAAERGGADSITAHLREDRRHMQDSDIFELRKKIATKLNLEMACNPEILDIALKIKPDYVCLVPENRMEITTEGGLDAASELEKISYYVGKLTEVGTQCSVFIDPDSSQIEAAAAAGAQMVELHTGAYANAWGNPDKIKAELSRISAAATRAAELGLTVNSGHGINYANVSRLLEAANFNELNIGHTIISRSLLCGIENAVREMKELLVKYGCF